MKVSMILSSFFLLAVLTTTSCFSHPMVVDNCKLDILSSLPVKMQRICLSFLYKMITGEVESLSPDEGKMLQGVGINQYWA